MPDPIPLWVQLLVSQGVPMPERECRFAPPRRWRADWAWPALRLALEIEGAVWTGGRHTRGSGFIKDIEKYNTLALMGWRLIRATPQMVSSGEVVDLVLKAMGAEGKGQS